MSTNIRSIRPDPARPYCRQRWALDAIVNSDGLSYGRHTGQISIRPRGMTFEPWTVGVTAVVGPSLEVVPDQLFLGELSPHEGRDFRVLMRFSPDVCPTDAAELEVTHDLGKAVTYELIRPPSASVWIIKCHLDVSLLKVSDGYARGILQVHVHGYMDPVKVPFMARVRS